MTPKQKFLLGAFETLRNYHWRGVPEEIINKVGHVTDYARESMELDLSAKPPKFENSNPEVDGGQAMARVTLLDYFAAAALTGFPTGSASVIYNREGITASNREDACRFKAEHCYDMARAMLKERKRVVTELKK